MTKEYSAMNGYFGRVGLPDAKTKFLQYFSAQDGLGVDLSVVSKGSKKVYSPILDTLDPLKASDQEVRGAMEDVERALQGKLHTKSNNYLRHLSFEIRQIIDSNQGDGVREWQRKGIEEIEAAITQHSSEQRPSVPEDRWSLQALQEYYENIRALEKDKLVKDAIGVAGAVVVQNETKQLYVARKNHTPEGTGWLAPLVGLTVDTSFTNDHRSQVHDVVAVVRQTNAALALLRGTDIGLYVQA